MVSPPRQRTFTINASPAIIGGIGLLSRPAAGPELGLHIYHQGGLGFSLKGLRLWALPAKMAGGHVTLTLWGLLLGPCFRQSLSTTSQIDSYLRLGVSSQHAAVEGYTNTYPTNRPWLVLGPHLSYRREFVPSLANKRTKPSRPF